MIKHLLPKLISLLFIITIAACNSSIPAAEQPTATNLAPVSKPATPTEPTEKTKNTASIPQTAGLSDEQLAQFAAFVEKARQSYNIPGAAVAIVYQNDIILAQGFGSRDLSNNAPVTPESLFHIGSTHKSITAMLMATLIDDGRLDWDTPVVEIYPDFELSDPQATEAVTIRHLLGMSSGIPDEAEDEFDPENSTPEDIFDLLAETPLLDSPGQEFSYSNLSCSAGAYIGVLAAGGKYGELYNGYAGLLQERILEPIGMETATLSVEQARANPNYSHSHEFDDNHLVVTAESYDFTGDPLAPTGSIKASVLDMARYMITQVNRGLAPNGVRVVSEENLTETWRPQIQEQDENFWYAMGWSVQILEDFEVIWHDGSYDGFTSILVFVPEMNTGMVVLNNMDDPGDFLEITRDEFVKMVSK